MRGRQENDVEKALNKGEKKKKKDNELNKWVSESEEWMKERFIVSAKVEIPREREKMNIFKIMPALHHNSRNSSKNNEDKKTLVK